MEGVLSLHVQLQPEKAEREGNSFSCQSIITLHTVCSLHTAQRWQYKLTSCSLFLLVRIWHGLSWVEDREKPLQPFHPYGCIFEVCVLFCSASQPGEWSGGWQQKEKREAVEKTTSSHPWPGRTLLPVMLLTHSLTSRKSLPGPNCTNSKSWITLCYLLQEHISRAC